MEIVQNITLDFARSTMPVTVFAKQYDKDTRKIEITPLNKGMPYTIENGVTACLQMTKPDGTTVIDDAAISNGKITVTLTGQCLTAAGTAVAEIGLYKGATLLTSQIFYIEVQRGAYDENAPESSDEYLALLRVLAECEEAIDSIEAKVPKTRKIAGIDLQADITAQALKTALSVPTKTSDLYNDSGFLTQHQDISGKVDKTRTIAGVDLQDDITVSELNDALELTDVVHIRVLDSDIYTKLPNDVEFGQMYTIIDYDDLNNEVYKHYVRNSVSRTLRQAHLMTEVEVTAYVNSAIGGIENGSY